MGEQVSIIYTNPGKLVTYNKYSMHFIDNSTLYSSYQSPHLISKNV
jgi:hypothetical protein